MLDIVITTDKIESANRLSRKVSKIEEFRQIDEKTGKAMTNIVSVWNSKNDQFVDNIKDSSALKKIARKSGKDIEEVYLEVEKRKHILEKLVKDKVFDIAKVHEEIQRYYSKN